MKTMPARLLFLIVFFFFFLFLLSTGNPRAEEQQPPLHTIAVSFDTARATVTGTSKISLPPNRELTLECGPLTVTGGVLNRPDQPPLTIRPGADNRIILPPLPQSQTLFLSWTLTTDGSGRDGNLVRPDGITLTGFWHPLADQDMLFAVTARLPRTMIGITEGSALKNTRKQRETILKNRTSRPLPGLHLAAGPYQVDKRRVGKTVLSTWFFPEDRELSKGFLEDGARYLRRYEKLLGPFPYPGYAIVENRLPTGYGMPGFTLLGQAVVRLPFIRKTSLGHEILHSWFGNSVGVAAQGGNWCEGLTTYLADQSFAAENGQGADYRKNQLLRYLASIRPDTGLPLSQFRGSADTSPMARAIRAVGYDKGAMLFHMLRRLIGDDAFFQGLRQLAREKARQRASWQDIQMIFSRAAGQDLAWFFSQWLNRTDIPRLSIQRISLDQDKGRSVIGFHLVQENTDTPPYRLQVPVIIETLGGPVKQTVMVDQADQEVSLRTDTLPTSLVLDPEYDLMRELTPAEVPPILNRFLGAEPRFVVLPDGDEAAAPYRPLAEMLEKQGARIRRAAEIKNSELAGGSWLLAGDSSLRRSLFGGPGDAGPGFTLRVRANPLAPSRVMVLVNAASAAETRAVLHRLHHYTKYSTLSFARGKIRTREIAPSMRGQRLELVNKPAGFPVQAQLPFDRILDRVADSRVIYVGETHTSYSDHLLQLQVLQALDARRQQGEELVIGMEMFPRSSQPALDRYVRGEIDEKAFIRQSRYFSVWGFDYRLYRGLIGYAARRKIPIIGLNLDKKIVSRVFRGGGLDDLSPEQRAAMAADRDLDVPGYRQRLASVFGRHERSPHGPGFSGFLQAQAIWDETMAESIATYLTAHPQARMVVIAGTGHVYRDSAIPLRVARRLPGIRQSVLVSDNGSDSGRETGRQVDFLIRTTPFTLSPPARIGVVLEKTEADGLSRLRITSLSPHGHGREAGLEEGDLILAMDGSPVHEVADLKIGLLDKQPGDTVRLRVRRHHTLLPDETLEIEVRLSALPAGGAMALPPGHPARK